MLGFFTWDLAVVISFVALGRDTHNESLDLARSFQTAAPFLIGLAAGWLPAHVRRRPSWVSSGIIVGSITLGGGLFLRSVVFAEGLSGAFPVVAALYLVGLMSSARVVWAGIARRRHQLDLGEELRSG